MDWRANLARQAGRLKGRIVDGTEVNFNDFTLDHLDSGEAEKMNNAIAQGKAFVDDLRSENVRAMFLIASSVEGDDTRTGYGCGKTMLAKAIYFANAYIQTYGPVDTIDDVNALKIARGSFYDARYIMSIFGGDFDPSVTFAEFGNLIVIDDVGREGALQYVKQDPEIQLQEKRDRYYSIIDYCYRAKKSIVITSNLTSRELAQFLGGASWSRLLQMAPTRYRLNLTGIRDMREILGEMGEF